MNAPWMVNKRNGSTQARDAFAAFVCDDETADTLAPVVTELGFTSDKIYKGGLRNAIQTLAVSSCPRLLLVDIAESVDSLSDINALAEVCEPGTIVLAVGSTNDVMLYRDLLASGIQDYLVKPLDPALVRDALTNANAAVHAPAPQALAPGEVKHVSTAVIGVRGGVGASTVASSLAWIIAHKMNQKTALLDLDVQFGVGALAFDLEPGRGLTDALENPSRVDSLFIERAIVKESDTLAILSAEAPIHMPLALDSTALHHLEGELKRAFPQTVVDLPRQIATGNPALLSELDHIVIVAELTLASTRDSIRLLSYLKSTVPNATVTVVANKVPKEAASAEVSRKDFEASIEHAVDFTIAADPKSTAAAARVGKSLPQVPEAVKTIAPLLSLAEKITGAAPVAKEGGSLAAKFQALAARIKKKA